MHTQRTGSNRLRLAAGIATAIAITSAATLAENPLRMEYSIEEAGGGLYEYQFWLILDNNDGSWEEGDGWGWIAFAHDPDDTLSPLYPYEMDPSYYPIGPYESMGLQGSATEPTAYTLNPPLLYWVPEEVGDAITWGGTSPEYVDQGEMFYSILLKQGQGGSPIVDKEPAILIDNEPCIADWNGDGVVNINDFFAYLQDFENGNPDADLTGSGNVNINDFFLYLEEFEAGC